MIKAIALVGFYRGDLVAPDQIIELPENEFAELRAFNKVDYAPVEPVATPKDRRSSK